MDQFDPEGPQVSDEDLILLAREGDRTAFGELWMRHARSGITVARRFTSNLDAEDLVAEAFARIYQRVLDGGGPDGAFRPYLYTTIRNLASRWGSERRDIQLEDIEDLRDDNLPEDPSMVALDAHLTARAFQSLPDRWQSVLWYTEVEGMAPQDVAPILGLTANGVAALAYRAREGLRTAWLQAHVSEAGTTADCRWVRSRLGGHARNALTDRERLRFDAHLEGCVKCGSVALEVDQVGSSIAVVMLPLLLGATAGGSLLASLAPAEAVAATPLPDVPAVFDTIAASAAPSVATAAGVGTTVAAGAGATASVPLLAAALAVTVALGGGVAVVLQPIPEPGPLAGMQHSVQPTDPEGSPEGQDGAVSEGTDPGAAGPQGDPDALGELVGDLVDPVSTIIPNLPVGPVPEHVAPDGLVGALVDLDLGGTGMPGATVSAQVAGQVYTTVVAANGTWAIRITALPEGIGPITLSQKLTILGIIVPLDIPLTLLSDTLGITVEILD
ncbi:MAG TPA: sigma-70 family RNA polymerase sigma factor [Terrimesophilobacter sp.]|nr:sigma-70 family RNA polymerase sigma factor [Terrimesophilobacter sp.]